MTGPQSLFPSARNISTSFSLPFSSVVRDTKIGGPCQLDLGSTCYLLTIRAVLKDKSISRFLTSVWGCCSISYHNASTAWSFKCHYYTNTGRACQRCDSMRLVEVVISNYVQNLFFKRICNFPCFCSFCTGSTSSVIDFTLKHTKFVYFWWS